MKEDWMGGFVREIAAMIIDTLNLEEVSIDDIDPAAPLFGDGLGLDSIDALELVLAISQNYGIQVKSDDQQNQQIFSSLATLASFVEIRKA
ncbi:phosphopantetheine-binding protein [Candidatus Vondammii sp. HM_W22]|uniref:phosphopantetheine-binding protein n=1 Tax=Candidatus Vondammii sp. HM_W22 TaxID=2687299 RepID=UPI002E7B628E|nr:phosphopantetheine-binding protein [Candidatus Vondammii sp. HM_W22]